MNNIQDQSKPVRPSLYGSKMATSTFSVLGAITPIGWSKQNVFLASFASFIVGGVMGGGVVGMVRQSEPTPASNISSQLSGLQVTQQAAQNIVLASTVMNQAVAKVSPPPITSEVGLTKPLSNPLASFKDSSDQQNSFQESNEQKIAKPIHKPKKMTHSDDLAMQKLIENKSISQLSAAKDQAQKRGIEKDRLDKEKIEAAFKDELPIKTVHLTKASNTPQAAIKSKKDKARDKDVLLVKSMLDTMDHSASKTKSSQSNSTSSSDLKK